MEQNNKREYLSLIKALVATQIHQQLIIEMLNA